MESVILPFPEETFSLSRFIGSDCARFSREPDMCFFDQQRLTDIPDGRMIAIIFDRS